MTSPPTILSICTCGKLECRIPFGFCHCGCGVITTSILATHRRRNMTKGMPNKFLPGHQGYRRQTVIDAMPFKLGGVYCRVIPLGKGFWAIVNERDYLRLMQWKWRAQYSKQSNAYYVCRRTSRSDGKRSVIFMHREVLGLLPDDPREGDHIYPGDTLNNSDSNLRIATRGQNSHNKRIQKNNRTGYKGICWVASRQKYVGQLKLNGKLVWKQEFDDPAVGFEARKKVVEKYHQEFGRIA